MGQIFYACAYDIESKTCCVVNADKFYSNCYNYSGAVLSMHYLLRQKPYYVMWGGDYVVIDDHLEYFSRKQDLLGLSTYLTYYDFEQNNGVLEEYSYYDKIKFIDANNKHWKRIDIRKEAIKYFDWENTYSVKFSGFLVNHTQKLAVNLANYYDQSKFLDNDGYDVSIDLLPVLTETGDGFHEILYDGVSANTTEKLAGKWCGDLLQIVEELPQSYQLIDCCFSGFETRADYCYHTFGVDEDNYVLEDNNCNLFKGVKIIFSIKRERLLFYVKAVINETNIKYVPVAVEDVELEKGKKIILRKLLAKKYSIEEIAYILDMPIETVKDIKNKL